MRRLDSWAFLLAIALLLSVGVYFGVVLSRHPKLEWFKLLNIIGLTSDLLGILVLSELAIQSRRISQFFVDWVAGLVLWGQSIVPLGAALGASVQGAGPSSAVTSAFFGAFFIYSLLPLAVLEGLVFGPDARTKFGIERRSRAFGLWLLLVGTIVQLVAAFRDLYA